MANFSKIRSSLTMNSTIFILSLFIISMGIMAMAECEEFGLSTREIYRRILAVGDHISYGALERDRTPCSQPGMSYYNCRAGAEVNPYTRGCSALTQCRS
ncbi:putative rapid ALkalinization Factor [Dioscorea sansibarensis]